MDLWLQNIKHTRVCIRKCHFRWIIYERAFKYSSRLLRPEKIFKLGRTPQNISFKWRNAKLERKHTKKKEEGKEWKVTMDCKKNSTNICETHFRVDRERWSGWECHKFVFLFLFFFFRSALLWSNTIPWEKKGLVDVFLWYIFSFVLFLVL